MGEPEQHWNWHWRDLQGFFRVSLGEVFINHSIWLFIDALDGYGKDNANELIKSVNSWFQACPPPAEFRVCFTCRHYPTLALPDGRLETCIENENEHDISSYVQARISVRSNDGHLAAIRADITSRASGVFMCEYLFSEKGADVNARCREHSNSTALQVALDQGHDGIVQVLLDYVAETEIECLEH